MKKVMQVAVIVVLVVAGLPLAVRGYRALKPDPLTFDRIEPKLSAAGFDVTPLQPASYGYVTGAVDGRSFTVNGIPVSVFLFEDSGRLNVAYANYQQDPGEAIANKMGITTMLGVESRPNPNPRTWPVKKGKYLFVPTTDDEVGVRPVIGAIKKL